MAVEISEQLELFGYAVLKQFWAEATPMEAFQSIGRIDEVEGIQSIQTLRPKHQSLADPNTYSGNYGVSEFPLHTDLAHWAIPPRFVALRNAGPDQFVPTFVADGWLAFSAVTGEELMRSLVLPRRPLVGGRHLLALAEPALPYPRPRLRWDELFLRPASPQSKQIFDFVRDLVRQLVPTRLFLSARGDTLVFDNWRILHGRGQVPPSQQGRRLTRCYFSEIYA